MAIAYARHTSLTSALVEALADLYAVVYAEPPYEEGPDEVAGFRGGLPEQAERGGFTLHTAHQGRALIGAAYGWTMPAGVWWRNADRNPPTDIHAADKLAVMEWIVHPRLRGRGVGAELMRRLLDGRPEPVATLAANPESAARGMYERAGWVQVARSMLPWGTPMDVLVLRLPAGGVHG
ncbi:GNAT family N-acetyltransferase [Verrucosispora sp. WMMC514]|uniref:GNAT family N-acetyltransferase n=1 Tax=Verrucosispora sp. WMMC514 TaxID=3015156 RepID=UPI00248B26A5|nr:GNAT family N-acetyltransferase [Verrucosispora sp. WMMC514]WBB89306.1 GNAT family N-acetyltransferase [Verrucosispora sp. WMMC514]